MPHRVGLRIAVQEQHGRPVAPRTSSISASRASACSSSKPSNTFSAEERLDDLVEIIGDCLGLLGGLREVDGHDVVTPECDHLAPLAVLDGLGGPEPVAGAQDAVEGSGGSAALEVTEDNVACLDTGALFDLARKCLRDAAETYVAELVRFGVLGHELFREGHALAHGDKAPLLALFGTLLEDVRDLI